MDNPVQDHAHDAGPNRSILCNRHNLALGGFGDSPEDLEAAAAYVRQWRDHIETAQKLLEEDACE